jgi:hypothetical protein
VLLTPDKYVIMIALLSNDLCLGSLQMIILSDNYIDDGWYMVAQCVFEFNNDYRFNKVAHTKKKML